MQFYHDVIIQKSYLYLQEIRKKYDFVLIGGWAVYLYSRSLKSKDIDIIVEYSQLAKMKENEIVSKNDRLKKYEIKTGEFDVDIYLDHYSELGIDIARIKQNVVTKEGFSVPCLEVLFLLKLHAWNNRRGSAKGQKDELDILSLAFLPEFDWGNYKQLVGKYGFGENDKLFIDLLKSKKNLKELDINNQKLAKLRKEIIGKLSN